MTTTSTPSATPWRRFIVGMTTYALAIVAASLAVRLADPPTAARVAPLNGFVLFAIGGITYSATTLAIWRRYR